MNDETVRSILRDEAIIKKNKRKIKLLIQRKITTEHSYGNYK